MPCQPFRDVHQAGAARPAQELAAGGDEQVTADPLDVDVELPERLGRVQQERHAVRPAQPPDPLDRLHQPRRRRNVRRRHQAHATCHQRALQRRQLDLARRGVGQHLHGGPAVALQAQQLQRAAHVARPGREHPRAGPQPQRRDRALPARRRALQQRDLPRLRAEHRRREAVHALQPRERGARRLVAAEQRLLPEMVDDRGEGRTGRQRGTGGVEVMARGASRGPGALGSCVDHRVDRHRGVGHGSAAAAATARAVVSTHRAASAAPCSAVACSTSRPHTPLALTWSVR